MEVSVLLGSPFKRRTCNSSKMNAFSWQALVQCLQDPLQPSVHHHTLPFQSSANDWPFPPKAGFLYREIFALVLPLGLAKILSGLQLSLFKSFLFPPHLILWDSFMHPGPILLPLSFVFHGNHPQNNCVHSQLCFSVCLALSLTLNLRIQCFVLIIVKFSREK